MLKNTETTMLKNWYKEGIFILLLTFSVAYPGNTLSPGYTDKPKWVASYGSETPYSPESHVTGFGMHNVRGSEKDALKKAKKQAISDLVRKVRSTVKTKVKSAVREVGNQYSDEYSSVTKSVARLEIQGMEFDIENINGTIYVLAVLDRRKTARRYRNMAAKTLERIESFRRLGADYEKKGEKDRALKTYLNLSSLFSKYYRQYSIAQFLQGDAASAFNELAKETADSTNNLQTPTQLVKWQQQVKEKINKLFDAPSSTPDEAINVLVRKMEWQNAQIHNNTFREINYQSSDFSSPFGSYIQKKLRNQILSSLPQGTTETVTTGQYWVWGDQIEVSVRLLTSHGEQLAVAETKFPKSGIPGNMKIKPGNFRQAVEDQSVISESNMGGGQINLAIRTDKAGASESLTLKNGEDLNVSFRVNQPCYLRITYILANGTKIMLEDEFRIEPLEVGQLVPYPKTFKAVPPLGVERLIVTAYSDPPPRQRTVTKEIGGTTYYHVIPESLSEMMAQTRGLQVKKDGMKIGTASLTITTVPK